MALRAADLAERTGYSLETIVKIETGVRRPSKQVAERLATVLSIPVGQQAAFLRSVAQVVLPDTQIVTKPPLHMGAEDFSFMAQKAPGAFAHIGAGKGDRPRPHHNPHFDIDEVVIARGAALLAETALRYLRNG